MEKSILSYSTKQKEEHQAQSPRVALVLSSGGIRGIAHVGILEILHQAGIPIDLIVGCSAGAMVGALYADGQDIDHVKKTSLHVASFSNNFRFFGFPALYNGLMKGYGFFSMNKVHDYLVKNIQATTFSQLNIPLYIVATNLYTGKIQTFSKGDLIQAICASSAIPGIFQPIYIDGDCYVDGAVLDPLPISVAKTQGVQCIIAANIGNNPSQIDTSKSINIVLQSFDISSRNLIQHSLQEADVIIDPNFAGASHLFTNQKGGIEIYEAGKRAAEKMLPTIEKCITKLA